jgi:hypothetical protein
VVSSLPDEQIVNDPVDPADTSAIPPTDPETPPLPVPELVLPAHDELPAEPVVYGDVLDRIRGKLSLPDVDHPRVKREIEWLQRNPDYVARVFGRAQRYLHHIANEVAATPRACGSSSRRPASATASSAITGRTSGATCSNPRAPRSNT